MAKDENIDRLQRVASKSAWFEGLEANPDFQEFKKERIDGRLKELLTGAGSCKLNTEEGREEAIRLLTLYQNVKGEFEDIFKIQKFAGGVANKALKKLEKK